MSPKICFQTITDASVSKIAEKCINLRQLCVSKCCELTDHTLIALATYNHYLNTLEVAGCTQFTDSGFIALAKVNEKLEPINKRHLINILLFFAELQISGTNGSGRM